VLLAVGVEEEVGAKGVSRPSTESEVAKLQVFNGSSEKVFGFIMAYIRMKIRKEVIKKQI